MKHSDPNEQASEPVVVRRFLGMPEALMAKSILDSAGIECFLWDEQMLGLDWLAAPALGGMRLVVRKQDAAAADELLTQEFRERDGSTEPPTEQRDPSE